MHELSASGRVREVDGQLVSGNMVLPLDQDIGWEAAVLDHFRAVATAIATKVRAGLTGAKASDAIGGSTLTFTVTPDHPLESEVRDLFRRTRLEAQELWNRVSAHNERHEPGPDQATKITFYVGRSGEILQRMRKTRGFDGHKLRGLHFGALIALTARAVGATLVTCNRGDFELLRQHDRFELLVLE